MKFLILIFTLFFTVDAFTNSGVLLRQESKSTRGDLSGLVDGFNVRNRDDKVNFGIVMPLMTKEDIFDFKISTVISPEIDVIRALGQRIPVPSNVSIPNQRESYSFFTINLNKPSFRLPSAEGATQVGVLEGIFPFTKVVDAFRSGRPLFSLVNDFNFSAFSLSGEIAEQMTSGISLKVGNTSIDNKITFNLEQDIPRGYVALGMTVNNIMEGDAENIPTLDYFPTDLKTLRTGREIDLGSSGEATPFIVMIPQSAFDSLENSTKNPVPFTLSWNSSTADEMLPIMEDLIKVNQSEVLIDADEINANEILGYKLTILKNDGENFEITGLGDIPSSLNIDGHLEEPARVRLDVFASNNGLTLESLNTNFLDLKLEDVAKEATLVSRYEIDFK